MLIDAIFSDLEWQTLTETVRGRHSYGVIPIGDTHTALNGVGKILNDVQHYSLCDNWASCLLWVWLYDIYTTETEWRSLRWHSKVIWNYISITYVPVCTASSCYLLLVCMSYH